MRTKLAIVAVALVLISTTMAAHAQPGSHPGPPPAYVQPAPAAPQETRIGYYGWQVLLCDVSSVIALFGERTTALGMGGYLLAGPLVHASHGNTGRAWASAGLRLGLPVLGGVIGGASEGSSDPLGVAYGMVVGGMVGAVGAMIIDSAALGWDQRPVQSARPLVAVPQVSVDEHGVSLGVLGRF